MLEYTVSKQKGSRMYYVHRVGDTERLSQLYPAKKKVLHKAADMQGIEYTRYMKIHRRDGACRA